MKVTYIGPHAGVMVPLPHGGEVTVEQGGVLETTADHATALLEQSTNWEAAQPAKKGGE